MTISSVLVGYATGDQRQIAPAESAETVASDPSLALPAGAWSAIDWEFASVLQALIPDVKEEPGQAVGKSKEEKTDSSGAPAAQVASAPAVVSLPKALPVTFSLAFNRDIAQAVTIPGPEATPDAPSTLVKESKTEVAGPPARTAAAVVKSDMTPATPTSTPRALDNPKEVFRVIPRRVSDAAPVNARSQSPIQKPLANTLEAEIVSAPPVRNSDILPTPPPNAPPPDVHVAPQPIAPAVTTNTIEAEVVSAAADHPNDVPVIRVEITEHKTVPVRAAAQIASSPIIDRGPTADKPKGRVSETEADAPRKTVAPTDEVPVAAPRVVETAPKPVEVAEKKSTDPAPNFVAIPEDQLLQNTKAEPAPGQTPNAAAPILQAAVTLSAAPIQIAPDKRADEKPKSHPAGLVAVQETKTDRGSTQESPEPPAAPANRKSTDLGQPVAELKAQSDPLSPADTEVAFTGRLVPRKTAEESTSHPESSRPVERVPQPESVEIKPAKEVQEAPVDHLARPIAEVRTEPGVVVSPVHREAPSAAASRPPEAPATPRSANNDVIHEPAMARETSGPVREISMRFNDTAQESAHLRVVEKGGEVLVSVRSGSEQLARTLSSDLGDLAHRLEQNGFQAELYRPAASNASSEPGHDRRDGSATADQNGNQSWSRERRDSQQHPGQKSREWVDDLEESMGLTQ